MIGPRKQSRVPSRKKLHTRLLFFDRGVSQCPRATTARCSTLVAALRGSLSCWPPAREVPPQPPSEPPAGTSGRLGLGATLVVAGRLLVTRFIPPPHV